MVSWADKLTCGNCNAELPERGNKRRRVPRRGGALKLVCVACAEEIDKQGTIDLDPETPAPATPSLRRPLRARRVA